MYNLHVAKNPKTNPSYVLWPVWLCVLTECRICANRLRQELGEGAGDQETGGAPLHHRAEGRRGAHAQDPEGLHEGGQLGHHPHRHHQEHRPRPGQAQGGTRLHSNEESKACRPLNSDLLSLRGNVHRRTRTINDQRNNLSDQLHIHDCFWNPLGVLTFMNIHVVLFRPFR